MYFFLFLCAIYDIFSLNNTFFHNIKEKKFFFLSKILFLPKLPFRRNGRQKKAVEENIKNFRILFSSFWILILARTSLHFNFFSTKKKFFFLLILHLFSIKICTFEASTKLENHLRAKNTVFLYMPHKNTKTALRMFFFILYRMCSENWM